MSTRDVSNITAIPSIRSHSFRFIFSLAACGRSGEYEEALKLFTDMKNQGLQPDRVSYNALFSALRIANKPREVGPSSTYGGCQILRPILMLVLILTCMTWYSVTTTQAFELWREICGKKQTESTSLATAKAHSSVSPDIITVTDVVGTLSRADKVDMKKIDLVFRDAVERGIILREDNLDSDYEVDLTGMSLPVARAACRFIFQRILQGVRRGEKVAEVALLTGVGWVQQQAGEKDKSQAKEDRRQPTPLREYVLQNLQEDFDPPMRGIIPPRAQGTVVIEKAQVEKWIAGQP